jgi:hypothetical protein
MAARQSYIASPSVTAFRMAPSLLHERDKLAICQSVLQEPLRLSRTSACFRTIEYPSRICISSLFRALSALYLDFPSVSSPAMPQGIRKSSWYWEPMRIHKACCGTPPSSPLVTRVPLAGGGLALPLDQQRCHIWGHPAVQSMSLLGIRHWNLRGCYGGHHNTQSMLCPIVGAEALFPRQCCPYVYRYLFK